MQGTYAHARFDNNDLDDDLELDARSPLVGKGKQSGLNYLGN